MLASKERNIYNELLTHHPISASDHTFFLEFGRTRFFFCSRCSGVIIGGLISMFATYLYERITNQVLNAEIAFLLCVLLPIPGLIDWGTQRLSFRKSNTRYRLFTGFILGNALHFMSFTTKYGLEMLFLVVFYFSIFGLMMYMGHRKEMKKFKEDLNQTPKKEILDDQDNF